MEKRFLNGDKRQYERYLPSLATLRSMEERLALIFKRRFGKMKQRHRHK